MPKLEIPNRFTPGTPALASEMNANFEAIEAWSESGQIETDSIAFPLSARSNNELGQAQPILRFVQTIDQPILQLQNNEGASQIEITQGQQLDAGSAIIKIVDEQFHSSANTYALRMQLKDTATNPAILITHSTETLKLSKSEFNVLNNTLKLSSTRLLIPRVESGSRPSDAEVGSIVFNSTTKQLNEKKEASGGWAPVGAPVGAIVMWPVATLPEGWVWCNGDAVPNGVGSLHGVTADFTALRAVVGANLPNFVGLYPRGAQMAGQTTQQVSDGGNETYSASAIGSKQRDQTAVNGLSGVTGNPTSSLDHVHRAIFLDEDGAVAASPEIPFGGADGDEQQYNTGGVEGGNPNLNHIHNVTINSTDTETRPATFSIGFIIKY